MALVHDVAGADDHLTVDQAVALQRGRPEVSSSGKCEMPARIVVRPQSRHIQNRPIMAASARVLQVWSGMRAVPPLIHSPRRLHSQFGHQQTVSENEPTRESATHYAPLFLSSAASD